MLLSVIIPSFNQADYIQDAISSCTTKTTSNVEILVLDGGSSDATVCKVKSNARKPDYFRSHPDNGQAAAINEGFSIARGNWIAFQNSDDYYVADALEHVCDFIKSEESSNYDLIVGGTIFVDKNGSLISEHRQKPLCRIAFSQRNYLHNQSMFISKELLNRAGVLDEKLSFCLDYEWFLRILSHKPRTKIINRIIGAQRFHEDTKTSGMQDVHDQEFKICRSRHFKKSEIIAGIFADPIYRIYRFLWSKIN